MSKDLSKKKKTVDIREFIALQHEKRRKLDVHSSSIPSTSTPQTHEATMRLPDSSKSLVKEFQIDVNSLPHDPGKRKKIVDYHPNERDVVKRAYIQGGSCQPHFHDFPQREIGGALRKFNSNWFYKYNWLEYSIENDAAFCFICYLFKNETSHAAGGDSFVTGGFRSWNKLDRFETHVGKVKSAHNQALQKFEAFVNPKASISSVFYKQSEKEKIEYRVRLTASLDCLKFLLRQGLATRGHDESEESSNRGNFLELLNWYAEKNEDVRSVVLKNAPGNNQMTSPKIQKDLINACAKKVTKVIIEELGDDYFGILADESSDVSNKEQMAICLRYVDKKGKIMERFLGIVHLGDTTALTLETAIKSVLAEHSLSFSKIRGQGYDGASNMSGEINGLKTLIMRETPSAYYTHCFAHQLQLTLVSVSRKNDDCGWLFDTLGSLLNLIGGSSKRAEFLRVSQAQIVAKALEDGQLESGKGLNQELGLARPSDTRWGSHYKSLLNVLTLFSPIIEVLEMIGKMSSSSEDRVKTMSICLVLESFDFIFLAHLMVSIFGLTNELNFALQRKDQDIVNAMSLVTLAKDRLQEMRDEGWESLLAKVSSFCGKNNILILDMDDGYTPPGKSRRFYGRVTNLHHFRVDVFLKVIDLQLQELNNRFDEVNMELLSCMACFNPVDSFTHFDVKKLVRLAEFYPCEFSNVDLRSLEFQLENFVADMRRDERFNDLKGLRELSVKLVQTKKDIIFPQIYLLLKLVLILPVATASVERVFSAMNIVKNRLRNGMSDQGMKTRRQQL